MESSWGRDAEEWKGDGDHNEEEAIGLKEAMSWVKEMQSTHCVFVTDSKNLAAACNGTPGETFFESIVSDCIQLMKYIDHVLIN